MLRIMCNSNEVVNFIRQANISDSDPKKVQRKICAVFLYIFLLCTRIHAMCVLITAAGVSTAARQSAATASRDR